MNRYFEAAEKLSKGDIITRYNNVTGQAEVVKWEVAPENIPVFNPGSSMVFIKAVETVTIPSIWKGFMGVANNGLNAISNKINSMFGSMSAQVENTVVDNQSPFKPTEVHTGVKVFMPRNEILRISSTPNCYKNGLVLVGGELVSFSTNPVEITLHFYNMLTTEITLQRGDTIAVAVFEKVESTAINVDSRDDNTPTPRPIPLINLDK